MSLHLEDPIHQIIYIILINAGIFWIGHNTELRKNKVYKIINIRKNLYDTILCKNIQLETFFMEKF